MVTGITKADVRYGAGWFAASLALYLASAARGLVWADSSKLTLYALSSYFPSLNPGDHAGWTLLASAWLCLVGGDPVVAAHRLSAVAGALSVWLLFLALRSRGVGPEQAHTAAALLLVALPVWWAATVAETYLPALALTLAGGLLLRSPARTLRWSLAGIVWGLALACHAMALFLMVPIVWEGARWRSWRLLPGIVVGSAPVWLAVFGGPVDPLTGFAAGSSATWRWHWEAFVALVRVPTGLAGLIALMLYSLGPLGVATIWYGRRERRAGAAWLVSLGVLALLLATYAPYRLHLMTTFLLVGMLLALPLRLGRLARVAHVLVQTSLYLVVPAVLTVAGWQGLGVRILPGRNNAFYFLCPVKGLPWGLGAWPPASLFDPGAERYVDDLGACAPQGAAVVADFNAGAPVRLAQRARGWRPDLEVYPVAVDVVLASRDPVARLLARIERELERRPLVLADTYEPYYHLSQVAARFALSPCRAGILVKARTGREAP
jgi:hypothetical protein